jgi:uncharacterized protein (TIGR02099 family)
MKPITFRGFVTYFVIHSVIIIAVIFSALRIMLPHLKGNLPQIEKLVSESFGVDIKVDKMDTGWRGFEPTLRLEGVTMLNADNQQPLAQIKCFDVQLDLFASLRHFKFIPGRLTLDGINLSFEQEENGNFRLRNHLSASEVSVLETLNTLVNHFKRLDVKNGNLELLMREGNPIYLNLHYMTFYSRDDHYRFESQLSAKDIPTKIKIIADIGAKLNALEQSKIDGYMELAHVRYDARFMPLKLNAINPQSGNLDMEAWFKWENGQWHEVVGSIALHQVMLQNVKHPQIVQPLSFDAKFAWQSLGGDFWRLSADHIILNLGNESNQNASLLLEAGSFEPWNLKLTSIAVDDVIDMLTLSDQIDPHTQEAIHHLAAKGEIHDLLWEAIPAEQGFKDWHLGFRLDNLYWNAYNKIPAGAGISGEVKVGQNQGQLTLNSKNTSFVLPNLFEAPLNIDEIQGVITWSHEDKWMVHSDSLVFTLPDGTLDSSFTLVVPQETTAATIDLKASISDFKQAVAKKYLPTKLLAPNLVKWINESVENGHVSTMKTVINGPLAKFPFKNGEGEYEMRFTLDEVDLRFHPSWPMIQHLSGDLVIEGTHLQASIDSGLINGSTLLPSTVTMEFTKAPEPLILKLSGSMKGSAYDAENFLKASPLWSKLGNIFNTVEIRGPLQLDIKTDIPLRGPPGNFKIDGKATLVNGAVKMNQWKLALEQVTGDLFFTQNTVKTPGIQAVFLDKPGLITAKTVTQGNFNDIIWNFHSTLNKSLIEKFSRTNYWIYFDGQSEYDASFKVSIPKREEPFALTLSSSLKGMTVNLPKPLTKSVDQPLPSSVTFTFLNPESMKTEFRVGDYVNGISILTKLNTNYQLSRALITLGTDVSPLPLPESGMTITGKIPHLIIQDWMIFFSNHAKQFPHNPGEKAPEVSITNLYAEDLQYKDWHLSHAQMNAQKRQDYWNVDLTSQEIEGVMRFPLQPEINPMNFDLARCAWPLGPEVKNESKLLPKDVYAMNLECKQFKYKNTNIGQFRLGIHPHRESNSVTFDPISIESETDKLTARAEWITMNGVLTTHFKGQAHSNNAGQSLRGWGVPTDVEDAKGEGNFDLTWPGSPKDFAGKILSGEVDLRMQNGRFVGVNPGFGRMLGLLSFQGLQRRLRLDFSDVFKSGFAFDTFKTNIAIKDGTASTENGSLKAPAADITFTGRTNLAKHDLDFDMIVNAHIDSTVPAAAVAIANPAAGAAVWIVDKMFNPLSNMTKYRYHVTGTWDKPEITDQTEAYRKELDGPAKVKEAQ